MLNNLVQIKFVCENVWTWQFYIGCRQFNCMSDLKNLSAKAIVCTGLDCLFGIKESSLQYKNSLSSFLISKWPTRLFECLHLIGRMAWVGWMAYSNWLEKFSVEGINYALHINYLQLLYSQSSPKTQHRKPKQLNTEPSCCFSIFSGQTDF